MSPTSRPSAIAFAALLGAVSGAVDVLVFTRLGEVFASVITGNVVVVGVAIGSGRFGVMSHAAVAVGCYAVGVVIATAFAMYRLTGVTTTYFTGTLTNLLTGLVTESTVNRAAAVALMSLLAGAAFSGALVSAAPTAAPALPLILLAAALAMIAVRRRRHT